MSTITHPPTKAMHDRSITPARDARRRRVLEGFGFVAVWVALGYLFPLNDETYLLMGVPLTLGFQLLVRRRPLRELWVRDATRFTLDRRGLVLGAVLVVTPAYFGARALPGAHWWLIGWYAAALVGGVLGAFALRATTLVAMLRSAALPMAVGAGGMAVVIGGIHIATGTPVHVLAVLGTVAKYIAIYFPVTFVLEEVAFRGALDAHVHHDGEGRAWQSAVFVSALWGLWHLPISTGMTFPVLIVVLLAVHIFIGVPLSFAWRRSRNLAGPAFAHSAIDAVRNALLLGL
jgi:membrane protease YdiL (CAAX protease family)